MTHGAPAAPERSLVERAAPRRGQWAIWAAGALSSAAVAIVSFRYVANVGDTPDVVAGNVFRTPWLVVHVAGAAVALLVGPLQFVRHIRRRAPALHRWIGRTYVAGCLVGAAAGLLLASGTSTGPISTAGFGTLAVLWMLVTGRAWRLATQRRFDEHREWMIRSFALTFAAVTLRLYVPMAVAVPMIPFLDAYRAISFLCWIPNLLAAELYVRAARANALKKTSAVARVP